MALISDYKYEVGIFAHAFNARIKALAHIDTEQRAGVQIADAVDYDFHVTVQKNENMFGVHPRYAVLARAITSNGGNTCLVQKGTIYKKLPILTLARFNILTAWDPLDAANAPDTAKITLAHKPDNTGTQLYIVVQKIPEQWN